MRALRIAVGLLVWSVVALAADPKYVGLTVNGLRLSDQHAWEQLVGETLEGKAKDEPVAGLKETGLPYIAVYNSSKSELLILQKWYGGYVGDGFQQALLVRTPAKPLQAYTANVDRFTVDPRLRLGISESTLTEVLGPPREILRSRRSKVYVYGQRSDSSQVTNMEKEYLLDFAEFTFQNGRLVKLYFGQLYP